MSLINDPKLFEVVGEIVKMRVTGDFSATFGSLTNSVMRQVSLTSDAWTELGTGTANRRTISVQNTSDNGNSILWAYQNTEAATFGFRIVDGGVRARDIDETVKVYGRMLSGTGTAMVDEGYVS